MVRELDSISSNLRVSSEFHLEHKSRQNLYSLESKSLKFGERLPVCRRFISSDRGGRTRRAGP